MFDWSLDLFLNSLRKKDKRFLANLPLEIPVPQLDGWDERVVYKALISLHDEGSHNVEERTTIVPNIISGNVMSSGVAANGPEDFFPPQSRMLVKGSQRSHSKSGFDVNPSQSALQKLVKDRTFHGEGWTWQKREMVIGWWSDPRVVRVDHFASGRIWSLRRVTSGEKGWPWEERWLSISRFATESCKILIASSSASYLAAPLSSPILENQEEL